jgi:hypothetical protein
VLTLLRRSTTALLPPCRKLGKCSNAGLLHVGAAAAPPAQAAPHSAAMAVARNLVFMIGTPCRQVEGKMFFFEKKNQKTFSLGART